MPQLFGKVIYTLIVLQSHCVEKLLTGGKSDVSLQKSCAAVTG